MSYEGYDAQQLKYRSYHDEGLSWDLVRIGLRTIQARLRVIADKKLIESLDSQQQEAMYLIAAAYNMITNGLGIKTCTWLQTPSTGHGDIHKGAALQADYFRWFANCDRNRLDPRMVLNTVADGLSLREIDRKYRQSRGKAKHNLAMCLDLWRV